MSEDAALEYFQHFFIPARDHQRGLAKKWEQYEDAFLGKPNEDTKESKQDWRSRLFPKFGYQQMQTLSSELASDDKPNFDYQPHNPQMDAYASTVGGLTNFQLVRDRYRLKRLRASLISAIYGGCPLKVYWDFRISKRRIRLPSGKKEIIDVVVKDQPTIDVIDPRSFYYDPKSTSMDDCRYVFHKVNTSLRDLKSRSRADGEPLYKNLDELEKNILSMADDSDYAHELSNDESGERRRAMREHIEVIEMWTPDRLIVIAGGKTVIRDEPNPFDHGRIPFEIAQTQLSLNDMWGISEMWSIKPHQDIIHTMMNNQLDALKLSIDPPLAVDVSDDVTNAERSIEPGARFPTRGQAADVISPINVTGVDYFASDGALKSLQEQMEFITGITREISGGASNNSATETAVNARAAKGRISTKLATVDDAWARCAEMFLSLNQQFLDFTKPQRILGSGGANWINLTPYEIAGMWDVVPSNSDERVVKELARENSVRALEVIMPLFGPEFVTPSGNVIDPEPVLRMYLKSFDINPDETLVPAQQLQEQMMQQQQAIGAAQGVAEAEQAAAATGLEPQAQAVDPFSEGAQAFGQFG